MNKLGRIYYVWVKYGYPAKYEKRAVKRTNKGWLVGKKEKVVEVIG